MREHRGRRWGLGVAAAVAWLVATAAPARGRIVGDDPAWWKFAKDGVPHFNMTKRRALAADSASAGRGLWRTI